MSTEILLPMENEIGKDSLERDFRYNNNVASSHIYIRMGKFSCQHHKYICYSKKKKVNTF